MQHREIAWHHYDAQYPPPASDRAEMDAALAAKGGGRAAQRSPHMKWERGKYP